MSQAETVGKKKPPASQSEFPVMRFFSGPAGAIGIAFLLAAAAIPGNGIGGIGVGFVLFILMLVLIDAQRMLLEFGRPRPHLHRTLVFFMLCAHLSAYGLLALVTVLASLSLSNYGYLPQELAFVNAFVTNWVARKCVQFGKGYADRVGNWLSVAGVAGVLVGGLIGDGELTREAIASGLLVAHATFGIGLFINFIVSGKPPTSGPSRWGFRGRGLGSVYDASRQIAERFGEDFKKGINWGGLQLPDEASTVHFYVTGSPGSGKTLTLRFMLSQILLDMQSTQNQRIALYDPKQELLPLIGALAGNAPVVLLNPLDTRATPWNLAHDFNDDASAEQLAAALIPDAKSGDRFWTAAPRAMLAGVIKALNHTAPLSWRLRDVLLITRSPVLLKTYLQSRPDLSHLRDLYFENEKTSSAILASLHADLAPYEIVAALWDHLEHQGVDTTAVRYFVEAPKGIVVFSNDAKYSASLSPFYRLFVARLSETLRSPRVADKVVGGGPSKQRTWLVIDEAATIGKLPGLPELLAEGRSRGACVVLGFQDIHHLYSVYGKDETNAILGQIGNRSVLRIENAVTAEIMAQQFSKREVIQTSKTSNPGGGTSTSSTIGEEQIVLGKQIQDLTRPIPGPLLGYFGCTYTDPYVGGYEAEQLLLAEKLEAKDVPNFIAHRDFETAQRLRTWDAGDEKRLGIKLMRRADVSEDELAKARAARNDIGGENSQRRKSGFFDDIA